MHKHAKISILCAVVTLSSIGVWSLANALGQEHMVASPFIAAEHPDTPKFNSHVVSTGKRNPFSVTARTANFSGGKYSGILIESPNPLYTPRGLSSIGFSYKGSEQGQATVEYTGPGLVVNRATANFGSGKNIETSKDGYKKVLLSSIDMGIPANSSIHKIVIAPPPGGVGRMLIDDITLNGDPVKKAMHTTFFQVNSGSPTGPLSAVAAVGACTKQTTSVKLENNDNRPVKIFFTLGVVDGCETNVQAIFPTMQLNTPGVTTIGYVTLQPNGRPGDSIISNSPSCYSGSFSAESVRINCSTDKFPNGQSLAEFIVNNGFQAGSPQETVDISCVAGSNAIWKFNLDDGQADWTVTTDTRTTPATTKKVRSIQNDDIYKNLGDIGVFPFGCTNCTNNLGVPCCAPPATPGSNMNSANPPGCEQQGTGVSFPPPPSTTWNPNPPQYAVCNPTWAPICNVQRPASCNGGQITITYMGPAKPNSKPLKKNLLFPG
ncbi:MAG: hypothetical protein C0469_11025 [Cyanobacteria bacterium DS2.3.42]|nr:hypothetical protein [Cyanobacteria bacterium DS2.3.42]